MKLNFKAKKEHRHGWFILNIQTTTHLKIARKRISFVAIVHLIDRICLSDFGIIKGKALAKTSNIVCQTFEICYSNNV